MATRGKRRRKRAKVLERTKHKIVLELHGETWLFRKRRDGWYRIITSEVQAFSARTRNVLAPIDHAHTRSGRRCRHACGSGKREYSCRIEVPIYGQKATRVQAIRFTEDEIARL